MPSPESITAQQVRLRIAGFGVQVCCEHWPQESSWYRLPYDPFIADQKNDLLLTLQVVPVDAPEVFVQDSVVFDTEYSWGLYRCQGQYLYRDRPQHAADSELIRSALIRQDFREATVYACRRPLERAGLINWALDLPLGQVLMTQALTAHSALILHCCAVSYRGEGLIFMGASGAGKSTLAGFWKEVEGAVVLSDERVVLRIRDGGVYLYGTPWTGSGLAFAQEEVRLSRIYFIEHAERNVIHTVSARQAWPLFLTNMRLPLWDEERTNRVFDAAEEVLASFPLFRLGFRPDAEVVSSITGHAV